MGHTHPNAFLEISVLALSIESWGLGMCHAVILTDLRDFTKFYVFLSRNWESVVWNKSGWRLTSQMSIWLDAWGHVFNFRISFMIRFDLFVNFFFSPAIILIWLRSAADLIFTQRSRLISNCIVYSRIQFRFWFGGKLFAVWLYC